MAYVPNGGPKSCNYGCLGFGSCVKACPFGAIQIVDGIAIVDKELCKACGKCIAACPKELIEFVPYEGKHFVQCSSHDKGKKVMDACAEGCIACRLCEKTCEHDAIHVENNVAHINKELCVECGECAAVSKTCNSLRKTRISYKLHCSVSSLLCKQLHYSVFVYTHKKGIRNEKIYRR